jgi:hypothetical protein
MISALRQDDIRALAGRQDVLAQVHLVDFRPDAPADFTRLLRRQVLVVMEIGRRVLEGRALMDEEALNIPGRDVGGLGIEVDREIKEV